MTCGGRFACVGTAAACLCVVGLFDRVGFRLFFVQSSCVCVTHARTGRLNMYVYNARVIFRFFISVCVCVYQCLCLHGCMRAITFVTHMYTCICGVSQSARCHMLHTCCICSSCSPFLSECLCVRTNTTITLKTSLFVYKVM